MSTALTQLTMPFMENNDVPFVSAKKEIGKDMRDDRYTPKYIFDALNCGIFDIDVAAAKDPDLAHVKARRYISENSLDIDWPKEAFIFGNPPYGERGSKMPWMVKGAEQGNGLWLMPDTTQTDWWQYMAGHCNAFLFPNKKIQFESPHGMKMDQPRNNSTIFAFGERAVAALMIAEGNKLGIWFIGRGGVGVLPGQQKL